MPLIHHLESVNALLWGSWTLYILLCSGILFTLWTKAIQTKILTHGVAVIRGHYDDTDSVGAISHFQALSAALSATIGLGNIGGVAIAISLGGPGALFWMWVVGFLGMALKTVEITLAMMFRNVDDPEDPHGGAMWVIEKTLGVKNGFQRYLAKALGIFFSLTLLIMTIAGGNMFQTWNVADITFHYFGLPKIGSGILLSLLVGMVIVGGIKRIGYVAGRLVPIMCLLYLLSALAVLALHIEKIPALLMLVFQGAFGPTEASGAFLGAGIGTAFQEGMKRALFSNEAGLGSAPIAHAAAKTNEPAREGLVGGLGPFVDTICICTLTALVILSTDTWNRSPYGHLQKPEGAPPASQEPTLLTLPTQASSLPALPQGGVWNKGNQIYVLVEVTDPEDGEQIRRKIYGTLAGDGPFAEKIVWDPIPSDAIWVKDQEGLPIQGFFLKLAGATMTGHAFDQAYPGLGKWLVTLAAWLFALSSMISWSYYGEQGIIYLWGKKAIFLYKLIFLGLGIVGAVLLETNKELASLQDFGTGGMLWANMLIVLSMGFLAIRTLRTYVHNLNEGRILPRS